MREEWKPIQGFPGYEISSHGRVLSRKRFHPKILAKSWNRQGYPKVSLYQNGRGKTFRIPRLVVKHFIGAIPSGHEVNHIDADKDNNFYKNLEIVSRVANMQHASDMLLLGKNSGEKNGAAKLNWRLVHEIRAMRKTTELSNRRIAKIFGISRGTVNALVNGKTWNAARNKI